MAHVSLARHGADENVVVIDGVAAGVGGTEPRNSMLTRLARTDVWYRTYKLRNDAAFTYTLSPNDSLEPLLGPRRSKPRPDPLNPNLSGPQSYVRLAGAPALTEATAAPVAAGVVVATAFESPTLRTRVRSRSTRHRASRRRETIRCWSCWILVPMATTYRCRRSSTP